MLYLQYVMCNAVLEQLVYICNKQTATRRNMHKLKKTHLKDTTYMCSEDYCLLGRDLPYPRCLFYGAVGSQTVQQPMVVRQKNDELYRILKETGTDTLSHNLPGGTGLNNEYPSR
jgi:hypothetical protein